MEPKYKMRCHLCLVSTELLIPVYNDSGTDVKEIAATVAKFTGVHLNIKQRICVSCWASVDNFQKFCRVVVEKQRVLRQLEESEEQNENNEEYIIGKDITDDEDKSRKLEKRKQYEQQKEKMDNEERRMKKTLVEVAQQGQQRKKNIRIAKTRIKSHTNEMEHRKQLEEHVSRAEPEEQQKEAERNENNKALLQQKVYEEAARLCQAEQQQKPHDDGMQGMEIEFRIVAKELKQHVRDVFDEGQLQPPVAQNEAEAQQTETNVISVGTRKPRGRPRKCQITKETKQPSANRESNARKRGRPSRSDASVILAEDHLIASHMQLSCELCKVTANTFSELKQHFQSAHQINGFAVCCKKRLYKRGILIDHINVHKNPAYFECQYCGSNFADRTCLRNHLLLKHKTESESPYQCEHCGKKFSKPYFLQRHALHHTTHAQCMFSCQHCKKSYPSSSRLKTHLKNVHGDGSLKVCNHCGIFVRGKNTFERHLAQHEGKAKLHSVQCQVCGQKLSDKYCLRLHMELHEDRRSYACALCGKDAPSRLALNAHHRYHHAQMEVLHKCDYCDKAFKTPRALREHITTHTGETLYSCQYCGKKFKCSSNLHAHRKRQHPADWERDRQPCRAGNPF